ncbi:MAG: hypothetical protein HN577_14420, partial [Rhodospirillaceae bacterium]|nr:hypothetical protein [Rhodospirillaceae bacterium]
GTAATIEPAASAEETTETFSTNAMIEAPDSSASTSPISPLLGDPLDIAGTGQLSFSETEDGNLLITDGLPWRAEVYVTPRSITIESASAALFSVRPGDVLPVPLDGQVVAVPGSLFVPLFLAHDLEAAALASLADASGMTWLFTEGGLRFELDGFVLEAAEAGASMVFTPDGIIASGFELTPL